MQDILIATVNEYIRDGLPVSSQALHENYDFGIGTASIRVELNDLEEKGWLSQPHTSGGRIPTNRAFEFFADIVRADIVAKNTKETHETDLAERFLEDELSDFIEGFASSMQLLSVGFDFLNDEIYKSGLDQLFAHLDVEEPHAYQEIAHDFEELDERIGHYLKGGHEETVGPMVFIGKKSPVTRSEHLTTIFDIFDVGGRTVFLGAIGPKRMDYKKSMHTFINLKKAVQNNDRSH